MSNRHAYMIICHNNYDILKRLLLFLDDERNDIYIHVDKKWKEFDKLQTIKLIKKATITFVKNYKVSWGGYSMINCSLSLLTEAIKLPHSYYHLVSGVDMPLKTQDYIYNFFEDNIGKEFIAVDKDSNLNEVNYNRVKYYHVFQEIIGRSDTGINKYIRILHNLLLKWQSKLKVNRLGELENKIYKGSQWFSITNEFAKYVVENKKFIRKHFSMSVCSDELFMQTLVMNSKFKDNISNFQTRYIDWDRGTPYTFRTEDFNELISVDSLFARKFDEKIDKKIVNDIFNYVVC